MISNKKRVLLRAPLLTISGYGVHSRQIFDYFSQRKDIDLTVQLLNWGITSWMIDSDLEGGLIGKIMACSKEVKQPFDLSVQVQLPDEWDNKIAYKNIGVSAFVETDICNPEWIKKCDLMSEIIVPSSFLKSVIERSGTTSRKINIVHEHFNSYIIKNSHNVKFDLNLKKKFNFLILGQLTGNNENNDRKNTVNMIKWFCETFADNPNVGLVLKTNMGRCTIKDRKSTTLAARELVGKFRKGKYPVIELIHGNMKSEEIAEIYKHKQIKCILSATRGEGYGLPLVDAASAGMPVVATNWSGHMDFLDEEYITPLEYELKEIHASRVDNRIFINGAKWAEVSEHEFKKKVLSVYENYSIAKKKAQRMQQKIRENFSRQAILSRYDEVFDKYLK